MYHAAIDSIDSPTWQSVQFLDIVYLPPTTVVNNNLFKYKHSHKKKKRISSTRSSVSTLGRSETGERGRWLLATTRRWEIPWYCCTSKMAFHPTCTTTTTYHLELGIEWIGITNVWWWLPLMGRPSESRQVNESPRVVFFEQQSPWLCSKIFLPSICCNINYRINRLALNSIRSPPPPYAYIRTMESGRAEIDGGKTVRTEANRNIYSNQKIQFGLEWTDRWPMAGYRPCDDLNE